jgi:hypothetical protein
MKTREGLIFLAVIGMAALLLDFTVLSRSPVSAQVPPAKLAQKIVPVPPTDTKAAATATKELVFGYDQPAEDLPSLGGWTLFVRATSGGSKESQVSIPYTGGAGPFTAAQTFTITGEAGSVVRKFFVLDAVSKNGMHSDPSNEVFYDFQIPFGNVSTPLNLTVKVKVLAQ